MEDMAPPAALVPGLARSGAVQFSKARQCLDAREHLGDDCLLQQMPMTSVVYMRSPMVNCGQDRQWET
jgi:hypothetical protein